MNAGKSVRRGFVGARPVDSNISGVMLAVWMLATHTYGATPELPKPPSSSSTERAKPQWRAIVHGNSHCFARPCASNRTITLPAGSSAKFKSMAVG